MTTPPGSRLLQPLVLTEDEAEMILSALQQLINEWGWDASKNHLCEAADKLYDKIKDAPR